MYSTCQAGQGAQHSRIVCHVRHYLAGIKGCELGQGSYGMKPFCSQLATAAHIQALHSSDNLSAA